MAEMLVDEEDSGDNNNSKEHYFCYTSTSVYNISFQWTIDQFSSKGQYPGDVIYSSFFANDNYDEVRWRLKIYPKGENEQVKEYASIYLEMQSESERSIDAKYRISILSPNDVEVYSLNSNFARSFVEGNGWGSRMYIEQQVLNSGEYLADDQLKLFCSIQMASKSVPTLEKLEQGIVSQRPSIHEDLETLQTESLFKDVTISVDGTDFEAHKIIMAAASPVFQAMFSHDLLEKQLNRVELKDVDCETFREMLSYFYSRKLGHLSLDILEKLLIAADKYAIDYLKRDCEKCLIQHVVVQNAIEMLEKADFYNCSLVKDFALNFICRRHPIEVMATDGWKRFVQAPSKLLDEILVKKAQYKSGI